MLDQGQPSSGGCLLGLPCREVAHGEQQIYYGHDGREEYIETTEDGDVGIGSLRQDLLGDLWIRASYLTFSKRVEGS